MADQYKFKLDVDSDGVYHGAPILGRKPAHTSEERHCYHCGKKLTGYNTKETAYGDKKKLRTKKRHFCFAHKQIGLEIEWKLQDDERRKKAKKAAKKYNKAAKKRKELKNGNKSSHKRHAKRNKEQLGTEQGESLAD